MKSLPAGRIDWTAEWTRYFDGCLTDKAKVDFLMMLKERRDRQADVEAGKVLNTLTIRWITDRYAP